MVSKVVHDQNNIYGAVYFCTQCWSLFGADWRTTRVCNHHKRVETRSMISDNPLITFILHRLTVQY